MSLMTAGDKLKVLILGNDGIMRSIMVERNATIAGNKYIITQKDVFLQRVKKMDLFWIDQPMIMFRENSIHAIPKDEDASYPTPQETADVIENAAMHLFTLFGKESNIWLIFILIAAIGAAALAGGGLYFAYQDNTQLKDLHADVATIQGSMVNMTGSGGTPIVFDNSGIPTATIAPRVTVGTSATPGLPKV
jgi:hypothetical protein